MTHTTPISRRTVLKLGAAAAGGLVLALHLPARPLRAATASAPAEGTLAPNAWLRIGIDDTVTVLVDRSEMGQGISTALPMLIAEELEVDPAGIRVEFAPADPAYTNPLLGMQATGGSTGVRAAWRPLREAGAVARELLIATAAAHWGVAPRDCRADNGAVLRASDGARLRYGELAARAAQRTLPDKVVLKDPAAFRVIGQRLARLDTRAKINGSAVFGMDVRLPGMLYAAIAQAPVFGGRVRRLDSAAAAGLPGVRKVVDLERAVAVVAESYWQAERALAAVTIEWEDGPHPQASSTALSEHYRELAGRSGRNAERAGNVDRALEQSTRRVQADYELPLLAHAAMEPMNCTADVRADRCQLWVPTQNQTGAQDVAARLTGLGRGAVSVHTTFLGGGFGRRSEQDFVAQAVRLSLAVGAPVQLIWSREQDLQHDFYRPASRHRLEGGLDGDGRVSAWRHRIVAAPIMPRVIAELGPAAMPGWLAGGLRAGLARLAGAASGLRIDRTAVEGAVGLPYALPDRAVEYQRPDTPVPAGFWRSVGHSHTAFAVESFVDELAAAAGRDPLALRLELLRDAPRERAVLNLAAERAGWGQPLPKGRGRGLAVHSSFGSIVAEVAEVSVAADGAIRVHRVTCAVDCGIAINPDGVRAQMEGAVAFALSAALKERITVRNGRVEQSNFHDYPLLRFHEMPQVDVHILPSGADPGGIGEPGVPPLAPAVANAVYAATGKRLRRLPLRMDEG